jgi:peptide/nickel transport system substrate-binding protein
MSTVVSGVPKAAAQPTSSGGILRIGWVGDLEGLNPLTAFSGWVTSFFLTIYESLLWYNQTDLKPVPLLATAYSVSPDGLSWTFTLVRNATWHDGVPFTSADVKFTYEFLKNGNFPCEAYPCSNAAAISSISTPDNYTVVLTTAKPLSIMATVIATLPILPQHIWGKLNYTQAVNFPNNPPIGTGPFKFVTWKAGEYAEVAVNQNYWRTPPHISGIIFKHYDSVDGVVLGLRSGEIDTVGISTLLATNVRELEQDPVIKVVISPNLRFNYIGFNQNDTNPVVNPTLQDPRVRLALRYTVDKSRYVNMSFLGYGVPGVSVIPPGMSFWYDNSLFNTYNLTLAAQILDSAGYKVGSDGIRVSPKGVKMVYNLYRVAGA